MVLVLHLTCLGFVGGKPTRGIQLLGALGAPLDVLPPRGFLDISEVKVLLRERLKALSTVDSGAAPAAQVVDGEKRSEEPGRRGGVRRGVL